MLCLFAGSLSKIRQNHWQIGAVQTGKNRWGQSLDLENLPSFEELHAGVAAQHQ
jgi:hypothetical protein